MLPEEIAQKYEVNSLSAQKALHNIQSGEVIFLAISGKMCAGKDTVAPLVAQALGFQNAEHEFFARSLKLEINQLIDVIKNTNSMAEAIVLANHDLNSQLSHLVIPVLYSDVQSGAITSAYDRTDNMRKALQLWGTEVRRSEDDQYWVKKAIQSTMGKLANATSVFVTDSRFPNEANAVMECGGILARIHVSPQLQKQRMLERDGREPSLAAINHISETAMDGYPFQIEVFSDNLSVDEVVSEIVSKVTS
jgi:hypothetical protein